jgi:hypothetical protein
MISRSKYFTAKDYHIRNGVSDPVYLGCRYHGLL